jgi:hypothetical protein
MRTRALPLPIGERAGERGELLKDLMDGRSCETRRRFPLKPQAARSARLARITFTDSPRTAPLSPTLSPVGRGSQDVRVIGPLYPVLADLLNFWRIFGLTPDM